VAGPLWKVTLTLNFQNGEKRENAPLHFHNGQLSIRPIIIANNSSVKCWSEIARVLITNIKKRIKITCLLTTLLGALVLTAGRLFAAQTDGALEYFVSPDGRDQWSGRLASPNDAKTDGPFATLERARNVLREARPVSDAKRPGAVLQLRAGSYPIERTFTLEKQDGGTAADPVIWRAYRNETVQLLGGRTVNDWKPVADEKILGRLDPAARSHVVQADLGSQGISNFGRLAARGFNHGVAVAALELFFQNRPMPLARWPNGEEWATIKDAPKGPEGGVFTCDTDRLAHWTNAPDAWVHGYWTYDWADSHEKIASIDPATHQITTVPPHGAYGYKPGRRFYAQNIFEELDAPGEWYLDRATGILYFWPPEALKEGSTLVSLLETPMVTIKNTEHLMLRGLVFEASRGAAIQMTDSRDCVVAGCTIRNMGTDGVIIRGGARCGVQSCEVSEIGDTGIELTGGDRKTLEPAGHFAINCRIHHQSRWDRTYHPAIGINGVGNRAAHNIIHDGPHNAILMGGNDHVVEYNDISSVCTQTGDAGAVYMGRDLAQRGTMVRYNYFHDIGPTINAAQTDRYTEVMAVYLDDCYCGVTILGNLFVRAGRAIMLGGGRDNTIENNIFVDCAQAIHVDQRGKGWAAKYFSADGDWQMFQHLKEVPYNQPPYSTRYSHLANILEDDPTAAKYNRILLNIRFGKGKWIDWLDGMSEKTVEITDNWTEGDPGFVAPASANYRLRDDAPVLKNGFKPLPLDQVGPQPDEYLN
jgi:hypothetical protein